MRVVLDTNIIVGAMLREGGASRAVLRLCLEKHAQPVIGVALFSEMEDVLAREDLFQASQLTPSERQELFAAYLSVTQWVPIYYTWRPNLRDEADNHVVDLAVAGNAEYIITQNVRDFVRMELQFPQLKQATAAEFLELWRKR
jgi:putative PIN family toxin of toxin-antitoxin system